MKITTKNKAILWSILEKYDGIKEYDKFCDAISNLIQDKNVSGDFLVVYNFLLKLDVIDQNKIDITIGADIDACLFSI
jgi:hypothetical protein